MGERSLCARNAEITLRLLPAFGIFAQGAQIRVPDGTVSIEDLALEDEVTGADGNPMTITWIGEVTLRPDALDAPWLRRVQPERFGFARPLSDVILGAGAEILLDPFTESSRPLDSYANDDMITALVPPTPVRLFQIACEAPGWVSANGLPVRTLDTDAFLSRQSGLVTTAFSKLMPGGLTAVPGERFVTSSPFRKARLGN